MSGYLMDIELPKFSFLFPFISLSVPPTVTVSPNRGIAHVGQDEFKIKCNASGFPNPVISWKKIDGEINVARIQAIGNELIIKNPSPIDSGTYKCLAVNNIGSSYANAVIVVIRTLLLFLLLTLQPAAVT